MALSSELNAQVAATQAHLAAVPRREPTTQDAINALIEGRVFALDEHVGTHGVDAGARQMIKELASLVDA